MPDTTTTNGLNGCRVLVVEDTFLVADSLADMLEDYGCEVVGPVPRLAAALPHAKQDKLDAALLDVNLAGEYCFPIASILAIREIPFAFLTGYGEEAIPAEFRDIPRLMKPFPREMLEQTLHAMLRRAA